MSHSGSLNHLETDKYGKDYGYSEQELDIPVWDPRNSRKVNHNVTLKKIHSARMRTVL